jgi:glutathione S-transferase
VGDSLTIADLALYSYVHCAGEGGFDLTELHGLAAWFERIARRPRHLAIDTVPS